MDSGTAYQVLKSEPFLIVILFLLRPEKVSDMLECETKKMEEKLELVKKMMELEK